MEFLVGKQSLAVAVVILQEEILVFVGEEAGTQLDDGVEVEVPAAAFGEDDGGSESAVVAQVAAGQLEDAAILEYVAVVAAVDNGYPGFELQLYVVIDGKCTHKRNFVPAARPDAVFSVRLMLDEERDLSDEAVVVDDRVREAYARIEVEVIHGERLLEYVPKSLLRVLQEKIGIEGEFTFRKTLGDAQLEFNVGVSRRRLVADRDTANKIIVLE